MAFISDGLEPMKLEYDEKAYAYKYEDKVTGEVKKISGVSKNQYLTPEQVNQILDTNLTDNSKLSYSDYSYYIYDTRDFTQEFVPLAYWGGNNKEEDGKVITLETAGEGFLKHWNIEDDNRDKEYYIVNRDGSGPYKKDESLETVERKTTTRDTETNNKAIRLISYFNDSNGSGHAGYYMALDDSSLPKDESFTVTFAVQCKSNTQGPLLSIGPKTATASNEGYLFAVDDNRLTVKDKGGFTIVQIYNAFSKSINTSGEGYNYFTFVFDNNKLYLYLNGELIADKNTNPDDYSSMVYNNYSQGKKYTSLGVYGSELQAVIGGFWSDVSHYSEDTKRTLNIDDIVLYDSALDAEHVEQMYNVLVGNSSTAVSTNTKAYDDSGDNIIATYKAALNEGSQADRAGWYFVNSGSDLTNFYETVGTAKELCGLPAGEVIYNYIDYEKLPLTEKVIASLKAAKAEDGNGGYIATSGKDFTGSGYLWNGDESATEITVGDAEHDCAITVPKGENRQYISGGYSPCVFFIDDAGYLRCFYNNGGNTHTVDSKGNDKFTDELRSGVSYVYQKDDETNIKTEDLQYALGQFSAQLHNATPNSMISAVRFSNQKIAKDYKDGVPKVGIEGVTANYEKDILKKFVMLDWTSDTKEISQILSLKRGNGGTLDKVDSNPKDKGLAKETTIEQYNYGMTGGTYTWTGFQAYTDLLDSRIKYGVDADPAKKYIILFTDGMDNTLENEGDEARDYAIKLAKTLKEDKDYTIFCVVLKNKSFETSGRAEKVQKYMAEIAGNTNTVDMTYEELSSGDPQNKYIFEADDVEGLTDAFTEQILDKISSNLIDYTVRDYIDPRFDLVDNEGNTIVLGKDGNVTGGTLNSSLPKDYPNDDENVKVVGTITNIDGEEAVLCYNKTEDRYYLDWFKQDIPGTTPKQNSLTIWSRTFRIKAKEDFIGGNAILSNGNKEKENWVFNDKDNDGDTSNDKDDASSGVDDAKLDKEDVDDVTNELKDPYVSKGFPRTAVNVRLLTPSIADAKDEIYMGETIDPNAVAKDIIQIVKSDYYWNYLGRYYSRKLNKGSDYETAFDNAIAALLDDTHKDTGFDVENYDGLKEYLNDNHIDVSAVNTAHKLTVDYMYLPNEAGDAYTNTVGDEDYQKDKTGTITYMIIQNTPDDELGGKVTTKDTNKRSYIIWAQFKADQIEDDGNEETDDKPRAKAVKDLVNDTDYSWDSTYKPVAGEEQREKHTEGPYEVDIVAGEIILECKLDDETLDYLKNHFPDTTIKYTANLMRSYDGLAASETVGQFTVNIDCNNGKSTAKATFEPVDAYTDRIPEYGLPIGEYTLDGETTLFDGTNNELLKKCFKFNTDSKAKANDIKDYYAGFTGYSDYTDVEKADLAEEHSDSAIYLGWKDSDKTTDYIKYRLGLFLIKGDIDKGSLSITQNVDYAADLYGKYDENTEFTFEVTLDAYGQFETEKGKETNIIGEPDMAFGTRSFKLENGETLTIKDIPVGTAFTVTEVPVPEGYTADPDTENGTINKDGKTVTVTNTYSASGELEVTEVTVDKESPTTNADKIKSINLGITNEYKASGTAKFKIQKTLQDKEENTIDWGGRKFTFTLTADAKNPEGATIPDNIELSSSAEQTFTINFSNITFDDGNSKDYKFILKEDAPADTQGITYDTKEYNIVVTVEDNGDGTIASTVKVNEDENGTATFTNTYEAKSVTWAPQVKKTLAGREWVEGDSFEFTITSASSNPADGVKMPTDKTATASGEVGTSNPATASFNAITFTKVGEYTFTIREDGTDGNGLTYDKRVYNVNVTVSDDGSGKLYIEAVTADGESVESFDFENIYTPAAATIDVSGAKSFALANGKAPEANEEFTFTFNVIETDSTWTEIISSDSKTVTFSGSDLSSTPSQKPIVDLLKKTYELKDIPEIQDGGYVKYYYKVTEANDGTAHISYDNAEYHITVTVSYSKESGVLSASYKVTDADGNDVENNAIAFSNTYIPDAVPATANITVTKDVDGDELPSDANFTFTFAVTETDADHNTLADVAPIPSITITNEGTDTFITREFTEEDIGNTYYYTITEVDGGIKGMSYADAQTVTVSVTYDELNNAVVATATPNPVVFINTYTRPDPSLAEIKLTKKVSDSSGKEYAEGSFTFEVNLTSHPEYSENGFTNGKATVTVDGGATVVLTVPFGAEYEITEINVPDGYTDSTEKLKGVADGSTVELIYNNVKTPKTGSLTLRKILVVDGRISEGGRKFRFKIELLGSDFTGDANGVSFDNGAAWVELSGGESVTMTGLPVGVDYVITEDSAVGYTLLSESSSGLSGTITADSEAVAIAVNATFGSRTPITPPPMTSEPDPDDRIEIIPSTEGGSGEGDEVPDESEPNPVTGALGSGMALLLSAALALATKRR